MDTNFSNGFFKAANAHREMVRDRVERAGQGRNNLAVAGGTGVGLLAGGLLSGGSPYGALAGAVGGSLLGGIEGSHLMEDAQRDAYMREYGYPDLRKNREVAEDVSRLEGAHSALRKDFLTGGGVGLLGGVLGHAVGGGRGAVVGAGVGAIGGIVGALAAKHHSWAHQDYSEAMRARGFTPSKEQTRGGEFFPGRQR